MFYLSGMPRTFSLNNTICALIRTVLHFVFTEGTNPLFKEENNVPLSKEAIFPGSLTELLRVFKDLGLFKKMSASGTTPANRFLPASSWAAQTLLYVFHLISFLVTKHGGLTQSIW